MYRILLIAGAIVLGAAATAQAQDHDGSAGYGGGAIWFGDFNGGGAGESLKLDPGWVATAHIEQWLGARRIGARLSTAFTRRPLEAVGDTRQINTWMINGDLLLRPLPASRGRSVAPFLAAGVGVVSYGLGHGEEVILTPEAARYSGDDERQLSLIGGVGVDVLPRLRVWGTDTGIRVEVVDNVVLESPFTRLDGGDHDPVHNIRVTLSLIGLVDFLKD